MIKGQKTYTLTNSYQFYNICSNQPLENHNTKLSRSHIHEHRLHNRNFQLNYNLKNKTSNHELSHNSNLKYDYKP